MTVVVSDEGGVPAFVPYPVIVYVVVDEGLTYCEPPDTNVPLIFTSEQFPFVVQYSIDEEPGEIVDGEA